MKKAILILSVLAVLLLMVSSATAVPQTNSKLVMEKLEKNELFQEFKEISLNSFEDEPASVLSPIIYALIGLIIGLILWVPAIFLGIMLLPVAFILLIAALVFYTLALLSGNFIAAVEFGVLAGSCVCGVIGCISLFVLPFVLAGLGFYYGF